MGSKGRKKIEGTEKFIRVHQSGFAFFTEMKENDYSIISVWFSALKFLGLSCWKIEKRGKKWVSKFSKIIFTINMIIVGVMLYILLKIIIYKHQPTIYKYSNIVFPMYTKALIITTTLFILCGNIYNRKFVDIMNLFPPQKAKLEGYFGCSFLQTKPKIKKVFIKTITWMLVLNSVKFYAEAHLVLTYPKAYRFIPYYSTYCAIFFSLHFVITMEYIRENYSYVNLVFKKVLYNHQITENKELYEKKKIKRKCWRTSFACVAASQKMSLRKKFSFWISVFMELRQVEDTVNNIFGKQMFLTFLLVFTGMIVNTYYYVTLNLYKTSTIWLNISFIAGVIEAVGVLFENIKAAEMATGEV